MELPALPKFRKITERRREGLNSNNEVIDKNHPIPVIHITLTLLWNAFQNILYYISIGTCKKLEILWKIPLVSTYTST